MSTTPLLASGYATPHSVASSSTSLSTTSKPPSKPKPVNVFSNDGSFLERFQRSRQEDDDKRKAEEALARKKQFADRFKNRGKRPPPDSPRAVTSTDLGANDNPAKRPKLDDAPLPQAPEYQKSVRDHAGRVLNDGGTGVPPVGQVVVS